MTGEPRISRPGQGPCPVEKRLNLRTRKHTYNTTNLGSECLENPSAMSGSYFSLKSEEKDVIKIVMNIINERNYNMIMIVHYCIHTKILFYAESFITTVGKNA